MAKIVAFSSEGDSCLLEYDPTVEKELETANRLIKKDDGKSALFFDDATGNPVHKLTAEDDVTLRVPHIRGG